MAWQLVLTRTDGGTVSLLDDFQSFQITPMLNGAAAVAVTLDPLNPAVAYASIGDRAIKAYQTSVLRFNGKVNEPLEIGNDTVTLMAKDPYAEFAQRRVRAQTTYTAQDAGVIAQARVTVQNGYLNTFLRNGTRQASVNHDRTYDPGKPEGEILTQLSEVQGGFFFQVTPVDNTPTVMGDLVIRYPDAGTTREEVRFEYGANTRDNLDSYKLTTTLPKNRLTVSSSDVAGGRLAAVAEDTTSENRYGLWEDELTFSDISVVATLAEHAAAELLPTPPLVVSCSPSVNAPLLFTDFNVGDFVRLRILYGTVDRFDWVRVLEGTLSVDQNGTETLSNLVVELVIGGKPSDPPEKRWRAMLDDYRRRVATLERRFQDLVVPSTPPAPPAAPAAPVALSSVSVTPDTLNTAGQQAVGTVTLSGPASGGGTTVTLTSSSFAAAVSASVTVPAGQTTATFTATAAAVSSTQTATITATSGGVSRTAILTVNPSAAPPPPPQRTPTVSMTQVLGDFTFNPQGRYAYVEGTVIPYDTETQVWFEVHLDASGAPDLSPSGFVTGTPPETKPAGEDPVTASAEIGPLLSGTNYWASIVAENSSGRGADSFMAFTTPTS